MLTLERWHRKKQNITKEMQRVNKEKMKHMLLAIENSINAGNEKRSNEFENVLIGDNLSHSNNIDKNNSGNNVKCQHNMTTMCMPTTFSEQAAPDVNKTPNGELSKPVNMLLNVKKNCTWKINKQRKCSGNIKKWSYSSSVPMKKYIPTLKDDYPRDEYTLMPRNFGATKYFNGKHINMDGHVDTVTLTRHMTKSNLPVNVMKCILEADPSLSERPVVFKAKHIQDIQKKHKCSLNTISSSQIALHISNDVNSTIFKQSMCFPQD